MTISHFRPMQYDCKSKGCFNEVHRLDFSQYYDALPGKISFSDLDGITEVAGNFLVLEWKSHAGELPVGQKLMFERMTRSNAFSVICAAGEKNSPVQAGLYHDGRWSGWRETDAGELFECVGLWSKWALANPRFR